ncbi:hypothetical protein FBQ82_03885 [Anaerolineae bacterium CFX7]|nr:hypothetical protein [Anaerolineae bacterium CFX7]
MTRIIAEGCRESIVESVRWRGDCDKTRGGRERSEPDEILDFGFLISNFEFWISDFEFPILNFQF